MAPKYQELFGSEASRQAQARYYGRSAAKPEGNPDDSLGPDEIAFIQERDSFYMASVAESGWPYIQHRGGPPGFLKVTGARQLAFLDLGGNRQLLTTGNLSLDGRVSLFLMNYPAQERLKIAARATILDVQEHSDQAAALVMPGMTGMGERIFVLDVVSFDWNCPQHITPRYTIPEVDKAILPLRDRIAELEAEVAALKKRHG